MRSSSFKSSIRKQASNTGCPAKRSGNTLPGRAVRECGALATTKARSVNMRGTRPTAATESKLWVRSKPIRLDCTTCTATQLSGFKTFGMTTTAEHRQMAAPGSAEAIIRAACCAAVPGNPVQSTCGRPSAAGASPTTDTATAAGSVLPGPFHEKRYPLEL
jgi:hypothetical protein